MTEMTETSVRADVRAWLEANWNVDYGLGEWRNKLIDSGWGVPTWPKDWYGRELPVGLQAVVDEEFARLGFESQHNLAYWRGADYLGLGPSACSTIGGLRWRNVPDTAAYVKRIIRAESVRGEHEALDEATRARERIMFGLRMREGVARDEFLALDRRLNELADLGLACIRNGRVCLTPRGKLVADSVAGMFV